VATRSGLLACVRRGHARSPDPNWHTVSLVWSARRGHTVATPGRRKGASRSFGSGPIPEWTVSGARRLVSPPSIEETYVRPQFGDWPFAFARIDAVSVRTQGGIELLEEESHRIERRVGTTGRSPGPPALSYSIAGYGRQYEGRHRSDGNHSIREAVRDKVPSDEPPDQASRTSIRFPSGSRTKRIRVPLAVVRGSLSVSTPASSPSWNASTPRLRAVDRGTNDDRSVRTSKYPSPAVRCRGEPPVTARRRSPRDSPSTGSGHEA